jgi:hypothetical protein
MGGTAQLVSLAHSSRSPINKFAALDERAALEPRYEAAMGRELARIADEIPAGEANIQIDIAFEIGMVEGIQDPLFKAWFPGAIAGAADRTARVSSQVPTHVGLGYHLCYGHCGHEHFLQPAHASRLVQIANAIAARVSRQIASVHLPFPRQRDAAASMALLTDLRLHSETEVYLGFDPSHRRHCGRRTPNRCLTAGPTQVRRCHGVRFGRRPAETVVPARQLHAAVAQPTGRARRSRHPDSGPSTVDARCPDRIVMIEPSTTCSLMEDVLMPDPVNLTGEIAAAIDGAALRGHPLAVAFVRDDGSASVTFRGGTYVHSPTQLAIWVRKRDSGLATAIAERPRLSLVFFETEGPGARYLAIEGRARVAPELDQEVYNAIVEPERQQDPERKGVAVVVEVDSVTGAGENGFFQQSRD